MPFRSMLLAAGLVALLLAGCGSENTALIPQDDADQLTALVSEAGDAIAAGECDRAHRAVAQAEQQLGGLPRKTDRRLKKNLRNWLDHLDGRIDRDCTAPEEEPEKTATPTPTEAPATPTPTPSASPSPTPTATASPEPTVTVDPGTGGQGSPEEPPGTGGVGGGDDQ